MTDRRRGLRRCTGLAHRRLSARRKPDELTGTSALATMLDVRTRTATAGLGVGGGREAGTVWREEGLWERIAGHISHNAEV